MKYLPTLLLCLMPLTLSSPLPQAQSTPDRPAPLPGFLGGSSQIEREWEGKFRAVPNPDNMREAMRLMSAHPHHVGSPYDQQNAEWMLARFKDWGWDAKIENFDVLFPTPKERRLELLDPAKFSTNTE